ncbi:MAG TPA: HEAT repeat domain-containing protein [Methanoculleus sp.]|nr:HEAT repeat domain-containing protein [Methanoculleus sp.]
MSEKDRRRRELRHIDPEVRWIALSMLEGEPAPWVTDLLVEALEDGEFESIRWQAAVLLGRRNDPAAVPHLIRSLGDANYHVREEAAEALGKIGDARAGEPLAALLRDPVRSVRLRAASALERLERGRR